MVNDSINPDHYRNSEGAQIIDIIRYMPFSIGNAFKYCYRNEHKGAPLNDLKKALWYLEDYRKAPEICSGGEKLTMELFEKVFTNVSQWEYDCCFKIFTLYKLILNDMPYAETYDAIIDFINVRIKEIS